jgi:hypothetical protein
MMTKKFPFLCVAACLLSVGNVAHALVVRADFNDMNTGDMRERAGQPAGTGIGFGEDYWIADTSAVQVRDRDLTPPPETQYALMQTGNPRLVQSTNSAPRQQARQVALPMDGVVWFSFLVKRVSASSAAGIGFNRSDYSIGNPNILAVEDKLVIDYAGSSDDVVVPGVFTTGETALVLGKIEVNAGDAGEDYVTVWVNPEVTDPRDPMVKHKEADFVGDAISYLNVISYNSGEIDMVMLSNETGGYFDVTGVAFPSYAYNPDPADGQRQVGMPNDSQVTVTLSWKTGTDPNGVLPYDPRIKKHYLFLSDDQNVSSDPELHYVDEIAVTRVDASYGSLALNYDGLYLWRVEEGLDDGKGGAYLPGDPNNLYGQTWSFYTLKSVPVIVEGPQNAAVFAGQDAAMTVIAEAAKPITAYQWFKTIDNANNTPDDDVLVFSGATAYVLTIPNAQISDEGYYYCAVSTSSGTTNSPVASLGINRLLSHWTLNQSDTVSGQYLDIVSGYNAAIQGQASPVYVPGADGTEKGAVVITPDSWAQAGAWDPTQYTKTLSISLWADWYGTNGDYQRLLCKNHISWNTQNTAWYIGNTGYYQNTSKIAFDSPANGTANVDLIDDSVTNPNTFQHLVITCDGQVAKVYLDGKLMHINDDAEGDGVFDLNYSAPDAPIGIGVGYADDGRHMFNGALDDIRFYNYALSPEEVGQLYYEVSGKPACVNPPAVGDFNGDCVINLSDLLVIAENWLTCGLYPVEDCQ